MRAQALRAAYDAQLRGVVPDPLPAEVTLERVGPLVCLTGLGHTGIVEYRDLGGLEGPALDELIARQVNAFRRRGWPFEWKLHGHDEPSES